MGQGRQAVISKACIGSNASGRMNCSVADFNTNANLIFILLCTRCSVGTFPFQGNALRRSPLPKAASTHDSKSSRPASPPPASRTQLESQSAATTQPSSSQPDTATQLALSQAHPNSATPHTPRSSPAACASTPAPSLPFASAGIAATRGGSSCGAGSAGAPCVAAAGSARRHRGTS